MKRFLVVLLIMLIFSGCSRTFIIQNNMSAENIQNIKIMNNSCRSGSSEVHLIDNKILNCSNLNLSRDTLRFIEEDSEIERSVPCSNIKKVVTRDGMGSFLQGMGLGAAFGMAGLFTVNSIENNGGSHGTGIPTSWVIGSVSGMILGFTIGEVLGVDKTFLFLGNN